MAVRLFHVLIGVIFITILLCYLYSVEIKSVQVTNFYTNFYIGNKSTIWKSIELKTNKETDSKCKLLWKNSKVEVTAYEKLHDIEDIFKNNFSTKQKPVKALYPDPIISLNPTKFLLSSPVNGPNNQLFGLRNATFIAIKLNRTLVIPRFYKHFTDSSVASKARIYLYPGHRIDIERYCKFVSCATIEQFREACGRQLDAMIYTRNFSRLLLRKWESYSGMKFIPKIKGNYTAMVPEDFNINLVPDMPIPGGHNKRRVYAENIADMFKTDASCLFYPRSLFELKIPTPAPAKRIDSELVKEQRDVKRLSDYQLYLSIADASTSPEYIRNIAKEFVLKKIKNRPFISVHWRYNQGDFTNRCGHLDDQPNVARLACNNLLRIEPEHISRAIESKILNLRQIPVDINDVYFASPTSERKLMTGIANILYEKHGWQTHSSLDLNDFMESQYDSCDTLKLHFNDIASTTEMEICALGTTFLGSNPSTWSEYVFINRRTSSAENIMAITDEEILPMSISVMKEVEE